jgi:2-polyprenyl-6-methoxyphenol hydroxylase-like FAD-dependent oxidoreductase
MVMYSSTADCLSHFIRGLSGVGGFIPIPEALQGSIKEDPVTMTFGPRGFFGYAPSTRSALEPSGDNGRKEIMWWSTYELPTPPERNMELTDIRKQLEDRHGSWTSPYDSRDTTIFQTIISTACGTETGDSSVIAAEKGVLVLPRYITPRLPRWCSSSGRIILLGDAAHAMPPDSGQGVSCAVEDALTIALLLKHYLGQWPTSTASGELDIAAVLKKTKQGYETLRMPRVHKILDRAKHTGNQKRESKWWEEKIRDWFIWIFCTSEFYFFF